ncbi:uncharacterized protein UV8b_04999 [Ustilaginoidea virens]|uniref:Major facilitator superfamily (MFS) profile domain-containing protein n=1 Tax=Ustilaginoidea virens TaxID=1159556 RepID=A0A8E5HSM0_USTVR|nr:uncharacterized protein UV8b_04999 [Ustilaginoidea virens]QUC20758.1 hypothetical protein UV8b_04999 [Ustilaginoidea virens]
MAASLDEMLPPPMTYNGRDSFFRGNRAFYNFYNDYSHISDPNLRRRLALSEIDKVPFGLYHVKAILVVGVGFLLDSYDIFSINSITTLLGIVFWSGDQVINGFGGNNGIIPDTTDQALRASTSAGILFGMILFGWLADALGRRRMYGIELAIIIFGTFSCALVSSSPSIGTTAVLVFWRLLMGIGIGGDYPLSSVITSEFAPTRWRGAMMSAVFSMQGLGHLMSGVVALITTVAFKSSFIRVPNEASCDADCRIAADRAWRIIVGVGAIPACLAMYYRITIPETPRYTFDIQHDVEKADADIKAYVSSKPTGECEGRRHSRSKVSENSLNLPRASWSDFLAYFGEWKNSRALIGTTMSWFFLDFAFYGLGSNHGIVLHAIGYGSGSSIYEKLWNNAMGTIVLTAAGSLPGYWTAVFTIDTIGRKPLQIFGFLLLTIVFSVLGFQFHHLSERALLALYIVAQFLFNAGPNTTTFVVPGECFPTRYRSSGHGLSAAFGKIGAILAQTISIPLLKDSGAVFECAGDTCSPYLDRLLKLFALFMFLGTCVSLLIPETKGITLEELSGESRTSYNAGCNGSISMGSPQMHSWNPLHGGQAAGFAYPRVRGAAPFGKGRQSPRVSAVTTSPELLAENSRQKSSRFWRRNSRTRMKSDRSNEIALRNRGSDISLDGQSMTQEQLQLPTWGAGWGRIDRGAPTPKISSVQLNDVGMLLRPN